MADTPAQLQACAPYVAAGCRPDTAATITEHLDAAAVTTLRLACRAARTPYAAGVRAVRVQSAADLAQATRCFPRAAHVQEDGSVLLRDVVPLLAARTHLEELAPRVALEDEPGAEQRQPALQRVPSAA